MQVKAKNNERNMQIHPLTYSCCTKKIIYSNYHIKCNETLETKIKISFNFKIKNCSL